MLQHKRRITDQDISGTSQFGVSKGRSISADLIVSLVLIMVLATIFVSAINYWLVTKQEKENLEQKADNYIEYLVESIELSLWTINEEYIYKIAESYYNNELVASLRISGTFKNKALYERYKYRESNLIERSSDVWHDGKIIGHIDLALTPRFYELRSMQVLRTSLVTALVIIVTMICMTSFLFRFFLGKSFSLLIDKTDALADGNYQLTEVNHKYREVVQVLKKFQEMGLKVQNREASLQEVNLRLEKEIQERKAVENSLRTSEQQLQAIINNMTSLLCLKDLKGRYLLVNKRFEQVYNTTRHQLIGWDDYDLFPNETADLLRMNDNIALNNSQPMEFEEVIYRDNDVRTYLSIKFPLYEPGGKPYALCGLATDITEHKRNEQRISDALEFNEKIISESPIGISIYQESGGCIAANESIASMIGVTKEKVLGLNLFADGVWNSDTLLDISKSALTEGEKKRMELKTVSEFGTAVALDCHIVPFYSEGKKHILFMAVDIRKRIDAEKESNRLRVFLNSIIDSMPSTIVGVDINGIVTLWNLEAEVQTGIRPEEAIGKKLDAVYPMLAMEQDHITAAIDECRPVEVPRLVPQENGSKRYFDMVIYPLVASGLGGVVIRIDDVSDRVRMEELMIQSEKMMSIGGLAAGMAHEINNPLAAILQNVQLLRNRLSVGIPKNRQAAEEFGIEIDAVEAYMSKRGIFAMIEAVLSAGQRASKIVENMLSFSRKGDTRFIYYNLADLLDRTIELAENDYDLKKKYDFRKIELVRNYDPGMPKVACEGSQIQQVFLNILKNGAQAMGDNSRLDGIPPRFQISSWVENEMACMSISDNGPGMDEEVRKRVFEPFFTTKDVGIGTGLGLSLSYFIITKNHNGYLSVESNPDKGSRFVIRLPLNQTS